MALMIAAHIFSAAAAGPPAPLPRAYVCPMHPDVVSTAPGTCPRCAMALAPSDPYDARNFIVETTVAPAAPVPGRPARLRLTVREPVTRAIVREFIDVHEKRL